MPTQATPRFIPGFLCASTLSENQPARLIKETELVQFLAQTGELPFWLHLNFTDQRCKKWLMQHLNLPATVIDCFTTPGHKLYLQQEGPVLHGRLNDFRHEFDLPASLDNNETTSLSFILTQHFIITGRLRAVQSAQALRQIISHGQMINTPSHLLGLLAQNYPETLEKIQLELLDELEQIEDQVLDERPHGERQHLMRLRRKIAQLHRQLRSLRRLLITSERSLENFPDSLKTTTQLLTHLDQDFESIEQRARFFHDEIDAKLTAETNRQLYLLSVLTAIFLPPTLVAGLFGMNVGAIPWAASAWGFPLAVGAGLLSSLLVGLLLWRFNHR